MREFFNYGSVRGTAPKGGPYRDSRKIDFSDIPELSDRQLSSMRRVGRPTRGDQLRKLIAIRLDPKVLSWLRKTAEKKAAISIAGQRTLASEMRKAS